ncbi:hypothetical protein TB2_027824 [Malus domestica]
MKVIKKIQESLMDEKKMVFSYELFPPKTDDGVENLLDMMDRMLPTALPSVTLYEPVNLANTTSSSLVASVFLFNSHPMAPKSRSSF